MLFKILIFFESLHHFPWSVLMLEITSSKQALTVFWRILYCWAVIELMTLRCLKILCFKKSDRASLVAQWLRICLPMQGTRVRALVWEDPACRGAAGPVSHNCWACASGACAPQQERPWWWEARAPRWGVAPACRDWRKPSHRNEDPTQPKINLKKKKKSQIKELECSKARMVHSSISESVCFLHW